LGLIPACADKFLLIPLADLSGGTIKSHNSFSWGQEKKIVASAREKLDSTISLALVEFEAKR
jgi:hypothetical protein